jgi:hypothetical protein
MAQALERRNVAPRQMINPTAICIDLNRNVFRHSTAVAFQPPFRQLSHA